MQVVRIGLAPLQSNKFTEFELLATDKLCAPLSRVPMGPWVDELTARGFEIADKASKEMTDCIDIILGSDIMWSVMSGRIHRIDSDLVASETDFGWVLQGKISSDYSCKEVSAYHVSIMENKFWELEGIGIGANEDNEEHPMMSNFRDTLRRDDKGRYEVPLTWKDDDNTRRLLNNKEIARNRLNSLNKKLERNPGLKTAYSQVLEEYVREGYIEEVKDDVGSEQETFYLPHHPVIKLSSETTKVRPVFDGSAKNSEGISLNDKLETGPSLLPHLVDVVIRFRRWPIGMTGDIQKAFLQLSVREEDSNYLRLLWADTVYRFRGVCFGLNCSPFLLNATIRTHLSTHENSSFASEMGQNFYVDDLLLGADSVEEASEKIVKAVRIMREACMDLVKWATNSDDLRERLPDLIDQSDLGKSDKKKILGIPWNVTDDTIGFPPVPIAPQTRPTKRVVLSVASAIYDPLGLCSPIVLPLKLLVQDLWRSGLDWDDGLTDSLSETFHRNVDNLKSIEGIVVERSYFGTRQLADIAILEFHMFSDASQQAYSACVYIKGIDLEGKVCVSLVMAKTRLAPIKAISLPRLELLGCLIGSRLLSRVHKALNLTCESKTFCWTDSTIALHWIQGEAMKYRPFVSNRIREIQKLTSTFKWSHCPGVRNPADQATRPIYGQWHDSQEWFNGPNWLKNLDLNDTSCVGVSEGISEVSEEVMLHISVDRPNDQHEDFRFDVSRFSSLRKALRVFSYVLRAVSIFKTRNNSFSEPPTRQELENSKIRLIQAGQRRYFKEELNELENASVVHESSSLKRLGAFLKDGIIFSRGRIPHSKPLIILPSKCDFTRSIIKQCHNEMCHAGVEGTLSELRNEYWIVKGRQTVKSVLIKCPPCQKVKLKAYAQKEAPLSSVRTQLARPFEISGCDHAGPFFTDKSKSYLLIFTCLVTRAIHVELSPDLQSETFLLAYRRFRARFENKVLISDNSKTFLSAREKMSSEVEWRLIPEYSPQWGGTWERLIRSIKTSLKKVLGRSSVSFEVLRTILSEIEASINKRPITYLSDDVNDNDDVLLKLASQGIRKRLNNPVSATNNWTKESKHRIKKS